MQTSKLPGSSERELSAQMLTAPAPDAFSLVGELSAPARLLFVCRDSKLQQAEVEALRRSGFFVAATSGVEDSLGRFRQGRPDLVIVDLAKPWREGYEFCSRARTDPAAADVPILVIAPGDDAESVALAYRTGATDYVAAPFDVRTLAHRARFLLRASAARRSARRSASRFSRARVFAKLAHWELDLSTQRFRWSDEARDIYGISAGETSVFEALLSRVVVEDRAAVAQALSGSHAIEYRLVPDDGRTRVVHQEAEVVVDPVTKRRLLVGATQDVTTVREAERHTLSLAYFDSLTGLPNRAFLRRFLEHAIADARRQNGKAAILLLDLDGFKRVNDVLGHAAGDELLCEVATRIGGSVRSCDSVASLSAESWRGLPGPIAARLGGDEFVVALTRLRTAEDAGLVATRIAEKLAGGFQIRGTEVFVSSSIGIATFPNNGDDVDSLLGHADAAMYQAKESGRNRVQFYTESIHEAARVRMELENRLRSALARARIIDARSSSCDDGRCEFHLVYQPKIELPGGRVTGVEALVRWDSSRGMVSPDEFITIAETTGLIVPLGAWILRTACIQAKHWAQGSRPLPVAVNVSARQLREHDFAALVKNTLDETGLDAALLELEITESVIMDDIPARHDLLAGLKRLGVRLALDDFGTGHSSLSYLMRLPIDSLKIDRSFVQRIEVPGEAAKISAAIINLAKNLGIDVVVEGIEHAEQLDTLSYTGRVEVQGFLVSKPMSPPELERWLEARHDVVPEVQAWMKAGT